MRSHPYFLFIPKSWRWSDLSLILKIIDKISLSLLKMGLFSTNILIPKWIGYPPEGKSQKNTHFYWKGTTKNYFDGKLFQHLDIVLNHVKCIYWPYNLLVRPISAGMAFKNITKYWDKLLECFIFVTYWRL